MATDDHAGFSYSGYTASALDAFPQYVAYLQGIPFPVLRIAESSLIVGYSTAPGGPILTSPYSAAWGEPTFSLSTASPSITAHFTTLNFTLNETASLGGTGEFFVLPAPHLYLRTLSFQLAAPSLSYLGGTVQLAGLNYAGDGARNFTWSVRGPEGALPGTATLNASGSFSATPDYQGTFTAPALHPTHLVLTFDT
ncbi:MAG: hypothetical protein L3K08_03330, partial [Thermoplasmata archaeon]|nr:hypothetical protein [Thermoplasmata archaeon]